MKNKSIVIIVSVVLGLGLILYLASSVIPKALTTLTKAESGGGSVSMANSYIIGEKISALSNGTDTCVVNVFVGDKNGMAVRGRTVVLSGMEDIVPAGAVTDSTGKATFEMTSKTAGQFELTAEVDGVTLPKTVRVTFRQK